ncbi:potassium channel KAT1 [Cryptomeria japonica]|uniref:potassium channel KAT1 n=1 Tax=Cryptomeria japonica TaxID=3369 RepID=UPI0025ABDE46|nr:potassium channel KAT1 [Cryptomeria japonica]
MQQIEMHRRVGWTNESILQQLHSLPRGYGRSSQPAPRELGRHIISPYDFRYRWWQNFLIPWVIYSAWVSPFEAGFLLQPIPLLSTLNNIINVFFTIDIALTFLVAYEDKHTYLLVDDPKKIAFKYLSTWFIFDVSSTIPFQALALLFTGKYASGLTFNLLHILRFWRLRKVSALFARLEKDIRINYFWLRCAKLISTTFFSIHCAGCCFHLIASRYKEPHNTWIANSISSNISEISLWERYVAAIYWALNTLSTVGYGDIHPQNVPEMIFDSVYMIFSLGLSAYLIGNMTNLIVQDSSRTRRFRSMVTAASNCASRNNLPEELQNQIIDFLCLKFRSEGYQQEHILDSLSSGLRLNIRQYLFLPILEKTYLFQGVSYSLLLQLVSEIQVVYFPAKHDVILQNEAPTNLYIIVSGAVELIVQSGGVDEQVSGIEFQKLEKVDMGDIFGEYGVLCNRPQPFWARTNKVSELLVLGRKALEGMLESYVEDKQIVMTNLFQI